MFGGGDDAVSEAGDIRPPRLGGWNVDEIKSRERPDIQPVRVYEQPVVGKSSAGRLEVQAAVHGDRANLVAVAARHRVEGRRAGEVGARREADQQSLSHTQDVPAFERRRSGD